MADFLAEGVMLAGLSGILGFLGAYGLASLVNTLPQSDMFAGLPVNGATTAMAFGALADRGHRLGAVSGVARGIADACGGAAL